MKAIEEGIKTVGVGKKGSKDLSKELVQHILEDLKQGDVPAIQKGAFFAGLWMKGPSKEEEVLLDFLPKGIAGLWKEVPQDIQDLCVLLMEKKELNERQSRKLGRFLFSEEEGDAVRGLVASLLRVRYETQDEYAGLLQAVEETFESPFHSNVPQGKPVIQIAEPFDGVDHSYLNTPVLAGFLEREGYRVVSLAGRNSGPKYGNNLFDLAKGIGAGFLKQNRGLTDDPQGFGYYLYQGDLSRAMDRWVDYRRALIKRPFMATIERFVNPVQADICLASAFHPPYGNKMVSICERAGFPACVIVRNGLEGTINFPLLRQTKVLASVRQGDAFIRKEFIFTPPKGFKIEERLDDPSLEENIRLLKEYQAHQKTDNAHWNARILYMHKSLQEVLTWIKQQQ